MQAEKDIAHWGYLKARKKKQQQQFFGGRNNIVILTEYIVGITSNIECIDSWAFIEKLCLTKQQHHRKSIRITRYSIPNYGTNQLRHQLLFWLDLFEIGLGGWRHDYDTSYSYKYRYNYSYWSASAAVCFGCCWYCIHIELSSWLFVYVLVLAFA